MTRAGRAYFVPDPSRWEDLIVPHLAGDERLYEIVKTVSLGAIDYGNFITDMLADRSFIEENHALCETAMCGAACSSESAGRRTAFSYYRRTIHMSAGRHM